jgi:hypothetical protein
MHVSINGTARLLCTSVVMMVHRGNRLTSPHPDIIAVERFVSCLQLLCELKVRGGEDEIGKLFPSRLHWML